MDLSRGAAFNYQGVGASQFVIMLPLLLMPVIIYSLFALFLDRIPAATILGLLGIAGLLYHKPVMNYVVERFIRRKYILRKDLERNKT